MRLVQLKLYAPPEIQGDGIVAARVDFQDLVALAKAKPGALAYGTPGTVRMAQVEPFLTKMYKTPADFVWSVSRDFVKQCTNPVLILPDDIPAHPYKVAMEAAMLAPNAEVSIFPWKDPKERIPLAIRQIRSFLRAHRTA